MFVRKRERERERERKRRKKIHYLLWRIIRHDKHPAKRVCMNELKNEGGNICMYVRERGRWLKAMVRDRKGIRFT